jgi:uncharacterized protein (TIGR02217 family)
MTIPAYRLPPNVEAGSQFSPVFNNVIQEALAGNEQRYGKWTKCRGVGNVAYGLLSTDPTYDDDFRAVMALYLAHKGSIYPFRFRDWTDYTATDENFGTGDGAETEFQIHKTYDPSMILLNTPGSLTYVRDIFLFVAAPTIKVNGVTQTVTTHYAISASGLVTFVTPPANGHAITWSGEFDLPVRFDGDIQVAPDAANIVRITSLPIREVIGET